MLKYNLELLFSSITLMSNHDIRVSFRIFSFGEKSRQKKNVIGFWMLKYKLELFFSSITLMSNHDIRVSFCIFSFGEKVSKKRT